MGDFNKIISFILGLIVVVVFIAVVTGRLNLRQRILGESAKKTTASAKITPTPTKKPNKSSGFSLFRRNTPTPTPKRASSAVALRPTVTPGYMTNYKTNKPIVPTAASAVQPGSGQALAQGSAPEGARGESGLSTIPATGAPTLLLPIAFSSLAAGLYLRRSRK